MGQVIEFSEWHAALIAARLHDLAAEVEISESYLHELHAGMVARGDDPDVALSVMSDVLIACRAAKRKLMAH